MPTANCRRLTSRVAGEDGRQDDLERVLRTVPCEGVEPALPGEHETHTNHQHAADHLLPRLLGAVGAERLEVSSLVAQLDPDGLVVKGGEFSVLRAPR